MSKQSFNLLNIEVGTFEQHYNQLVLTIDRKQFGYDEIKELNALKTVKSNFLKLISLVEQENYVVFTYELPNNVKTLKELPKENAVIRTTIGKMITTQLISEVHPTEHVSLNPANIWYYPMRHVWYAYRANALMPYDDEHTILRQYQALILFCLTGIPYERLLDDLNTALGKHQDALLNTIISVHSLKELQLAVNEIEDFVSYQTLQNLEKKQRQVKKNHKYWIVSVIVITLLLLVVVHKKVEQKYNIRDKQMQMKFKNLKYHNEIQNDLKNHHWHDAKIMMDKAGYDNDKQVQMFLKVNQYQQSLNIKPSQLNKIVNLAYKNDDKKSILDLELPFNVSDRLKDNLKLEKAIIKYDTDEMSKQLPFVSNVDTMMRMGETYLKHKDHQDAASMQRKLVGIDNHKAQYLKALQNEDATFNTVKQAENKLIQAQHLNGKKHRNKKDKIKEAQNNLASAKKDLKTLQSQIKAGD